MFLFCSDTHLNKGPKEERFSLILKKTLQSFDIKALFFLGDIFEFWWGDDHHFAPYTQWEKFFLEINVDKYFIIGNRDFLLGDNFFKKTKITPLRAGSILSIDQYHLRLYHGDESALLDRKYQIFKKIIRNPTLKKMWLQIPTFLRQKISRTGRTFSNAPSQLDYDYDRWTKNIPIKISAIVHGHCHYESLSQNKECTIITLGDWQEERGSLLLIDKTGQPFFINTEGNFIKAEKYINLKKEKNMIKYLAI